MPYSFVVIRHFSTMDIIDSGSTSTPMVYLSFYLSISLLKSQLPHNTLLQFTRVSAVKFRTFSSAEYSLGLPHFHKIPVPVTERIGLQLELQCLIFLLAWAFVLFCLNVSFIQCILKLCKISFFIYCWMTVCYNWANSLPKFTHCQMMWKDVCLDFFISWCVNQEEVMY